MYDCCKLINFAYRATIIPGIVLIIWLTGLISLLTVQICMLTFTVIFVILPLIFRYSITLQRGILFLTFITYPKHLDLSNPSSVGLYGTRSFFLTVVDADADADTNSVNDANNDDDNDNGKNEDKTNDNDNNIDDTNKSNNNTGNGSSKLSLNGIKIGLWHILPKTMMKRFASKLQINENNFNDVTHVTTDVEGDKFMELDTKFPLITLDNEQEFYERLLKIPGHTIILYLHGNTASRGSGHRVDVYKMLRTLDYHVITLDYRGYGDSDPVSPTEEGIVRDAMTAYKYIKAITTNPIIIWGHSLGTGVATHMLAQLNYMNDIGPRGVILEAPFTNIREEIRQHPFARPFKHLPWFDMTIARPMYTNSLRFESDQHISEFRQPILILHAEDDYVVPFQLGYKLYRIALDTRAKSWGPIEFCRFPAIRNYGHKHICYAPELPEIIEHFVNTYRNEFF